MKALLTWFSHGLNLLPKSLFISLGKALGLVWLYVVRIRRETVLDNLKKAFPEKSTKELVRIRRKNYQHYGITFLESLRSLTWSHQTLKERVRIIGREHVEAIRSQNKGAFFLTAHYGNWEVGAAAVVASGIPFDIVVKRAASPVSEALISWQREKKGIGLIVETGTSRQILSAMATGRFVGFMLDQFMGPPVGIPVKFFDRVAGTPVAMALFTEKDRYPVLPVYCERDEQGELSVVIEPPVKYLNVSEKKADRIYQKTQIYNDWIEKVVKRKPEQWLWLHRRWKPFVGESKWQLSLLVALLLNLSCASNAPKQTGIVLPAERKISIPNFDEIDKVEVSDLGTKKLIRAKKKRPKKSKKKQKVEVPVQVLPMFDRGALPFDVGERLVLGLGWTMIPAGKAVLEVKKGPVISGRPTFLLEGHAQSNALVSRIYAIDNRAYSYVDQKALIPYRFELTMLETHQTKETRVKFDHVRQIAHYQADRVSKKWGNQKDDRQDKTEPFVKDLFSALYFVRTLDFAKDKTESFYLYENNQTFEVRLTPVSNELLSVRAGVFQCWKLKLELKLNNVLKPMGDVFLWLSDDSKKYIVKFDAKIKIGSLVGELLEVREKL